MAFLRLVVAVLSLVATFNGNTRISNAAPGGKPAGSDVTKNVLVTDSSPTPVVIGEVVGVYSTGTAIETNVKGFFVLLDPTTVPFSPLPNPPAMAVVTSDTGKEIQGTEEELFFGDAACAGTPFFTRPSSMFTRTFVSYNGTYTFWYLPTTETGVANVAYFYRWTRAGGCNGATGTLAIAYPGSPSTYTLANVTLPLKVTNP